jgi:hypothetical protein
MHARVATFEGEDRGPEYEQQIEQIRSDVQSGNRPPGLEDAKGVLILPARVASALRSRSSRARKGCAAATPRSTR